MQEFVPEQFNTVLSESIDEYQKKTFIDKQKLLKFLTLRNDMDGNTLRKMDKDEFVKNFSFENSGICLSASAILYDIHNFSAVIYESIISCKIADVPKSRHSCIQYLWNMEHLNTFDELTDDMNLIFDEETGFFSLTTNECVRLYPPESYILHIHGIAIADTSPLFKINIPSITDQEKSLQYKITLKYDSHNKAYTLTSNTKKIHITSSIINKIKSKLDAFKNRKQWLDKVSIIRTVSSIIFGENYIGDCIYEIFEKHSYLNADNILDNIMQGQKHSFVNIISDTIQNRNETFDAWDTKKDCNTLRQLLLTIYKDNVTSIRALLDTFMILTIHAPTDGIKFNDYNTTQIIYTLINKRLKILPEHIDSTLQNLIIQYFVENKIDGNKLLEMSQNDLIIYNFERSLEENMLLQEALLKVYNALLSYKNDKQLDIYGVGTITQSCLKERWNIIFVITCIIFNDINIGNFIYNIFMENNWV
eukprot:489296_1